MLTFTYHCRVCDTVFEVEQSINDDPIAACPQCLVCTRNRLIDGGSGFVLKGGGWAGDLYSKSSDKGNDE